MRRSRAIEGGRRTVRGVVLGCLDEPGVAVDAVKHLADEFPFIAVLVALPQYDSALEAA